MGHLYTYLIPLPHIINKQKVKPIQYFTSMINNPEYMDMSCHLVTKYTYNIDRY